jgi:hypothetical protein
MNEVVKRTIMLLIITFSFSFSVNAQETENKETGKICFLRSTGLTSSGYGFKMFIDDKFVCKLNNKKYSVHEVAVGKHNCFIKGGRKKPDGTAEKFEIQVDAGKITYVQLILKIRFLRGSDIYFELVPEDLTKKKIEKMTEDTKCF